MNSNLIRSSFIKFFEEKKHEFVQSSSIVSKNDPSLMFTNAGMNQFKNIFLGNESSKFNRVVNSQKCLRVSGKHNDLEEVGADHYLQNSNFLTFQTWCDDNDQYPLPLNHYAYLKPLSIFEN